MIHKNYAGRFYDKEQKRKAILEAIVFGLVMFMIFGLYIILTV